MSPDQVFHQVPKRVNGRIFHAHPPTREGMGARAGSRVEKRWTPDQGNEPRLRRGEERPLSEGVDVRSLHPDQEVIMNTIKFGGPHGAVRVFILLPILALVLWGLQVPLEAQETGTISGQVTNAQSMQPIGAAQVSIPGLGLGSIADGNGNYELSGVPAGTHQVRFEYLGFAPVQREVTVGAGETVRVDVEMSPRAIALDEMVVTGVGIVEERRRIGQTISSVSEADLQASVAGGLTEALQGRIPGMVVEPQGDVGASSPIRLRGTVSLSQRNDPVIYIDGVRVDNTHTQVAGLTTSPLDQINPGDIERIEVIKGAAAATLYGTEASSGVIQITTRRGQSGDPQFTFDVSAGLLYTNPDRISRNFMFVPETNEIVSNHPAADFVEARGRQEYNLAVRGGTESMQYFGSARWLDEAGPMPMNEQDNLSLRTSLAFQHTDRFETRFNMNVARNNILSGHAPGGWGIVAEFTLADPTFQDEFRQYGEMFETIRGALNSPTNQQVDHTTLSGRAMYQWRDNIRSEVQLGYNLVDEELIREIVPGEAMRNMEGQRFISNRHRSSITIEGNTSWSVDLTPSITSSFVVGGQSFWEDRVTRETGVMDFPSPGLRTFRGGSTVYHVDEFSEEVINAGIFLQEQLGFQNRLFLTGGVRMDGNSAFGDDFGFQFYPKFGTSWVVSDHDFWDGMEARGWPHLRLRYAFGTSGLQPGAFDALRTFEPIAVLDNSPAVLPLNLGNPDLQPERSLEHEWGAEMEFLNGRLGAEVVYYRQETRDALLAAPSAPSEGFLQRQLLNLGALESSGVEVSVDWTALERPGFTWRLHPQFSTVNQEVTDMGGVSDFRVTGGRRHNMIAEGFAPGAILYRTLDPNQPYSLAVDSYDEFTSLTQVEPNFLRNAAGGDSIIYHGESNPTFSGSLRSTLELSNGLSLGVVFSGAGGFLMSNETELIREAVGITERVNEFRRDLANPNTSTARRQEIAEAYGTKHPQDIYAWAEDGDYIRLQEVRVSYPFSPDFASRLGMNALSVSLTGRNLHTFTGYSGIMDPGTSAIPGPFTNNVDYYGPPRAQRFGIQFRGAW